MRCEPEDLEPLEAVAAGSSDAGGYSSGWPDSVVENASRQGLAESFVRGRSATVSSDPFRKDGSQGQHSFSSTTIHEEQRGAFYWPTAVSSEMQRSYGQVGNRYPDTEYHSKLQLQQQESWHQPSYPPASTLYDPTPPPFSPYPHRSLGKESEKDIGPNGQTSMAIMRDEQTSMYGNSPHYVAPDRHFGYDQPAWLPTDQNTAHQGSHSGIQETFLLPRPSRSNNVHFTTMNSQGNTDGMWSSNRNDSGGSFEPQYHPDPSQDGTQGSAHNFYTS